MSNIKDNCCFKKPFFQKNKLSVGFDLGTTYSLVSHFSNEKIKIFTDKQNRTLLPSVVKYEKNLISVGWNALDSTVKDVKNTIFSVKRLIGLSHKKIQELYPDLPYLFHEDIKKNILYIKTNYGNLTIPFIISNILDVLKERVTNYFQQEIDYSVITVPAYFDNIQREETKKSAFLSGLKDIRLINEPTSAAIAYGCNFKKKELVAIYDLGGGTFDFSLLKLNGDIFEVISTNGHSHLGGDDFDILLSKYILKKLNFSYLDITDKYKRKILMISRNVKKQLSIKHSINMKIEKKNICITRNEFNELITPLINKTLLICKETLSSIEMNINKIDEIVLVGGSTYIPIIKEKVAKFFQKQPLDNINPEEVVAIGAGIHAENLLNHSNNKKKLLLLDVIPLSLGIEVVGGTVEKIISRNSKIPISCTKEFTTFKNNQTSIKIHVLQGERELVKNCRSLIQFSLKGLKPEPAGITRILVNFKVNHDGILEISVLDKISKVKKNVKVNNILSLEQNLINKIVKESIIFLEEDKNNKKNIDNLNNAIQILDIISVALKKDKYLLKSKNELIEIQNAYKSLKISVENKDFSRLSEKIKNIELISKRFFDKRLSLALKKNIRKIDDLRKY